MRHVSGLPGRDSLEGGSHPMNILSRKDKLCMAKGEITYHSPASGASGTVVCAAPEAFVPTDVAAMLPGEGAEMPSGWCVWPWTKTAPI